MHSPAALILIALGIGALATEPAPRDHATLAIVGASLIPEAQARAPRLRPRPVKTKPKAKGTPKAKAKGKPKPKAKTSKARRIPTTVYSISTKKLTAKRVKQKRFRVGDMGRRPGGKTVKGRGGKALYGASSKYGARAEKLKVRTGQRGRPKTKGPGRPRKEWGMVEYRLKARTQRRAVDTRGWKRSQYYSYANVPKGQRRGLIKNGVPGPKLCRKMKQRAERGYKPGQAYKPGRKAVSGSRALVVNGRGAKSSGKKRSNVILPSNMFRTQKGKANKHVTQPKGTALR